MYPRTTEGAVHSALTALTGGGWDHSIGRESKTMPRGQLPLEFTRRPTEFVPGVWVIWSFPKFSRGSAKNARTVDRSSSRLFLRPDFDGVSHTESLGLENTTAGFGRILAGFRSAAGTAEGIPLFSSVLHPAWKSGTRGKIGCHTGHFCSWPGLAGFWPDSIQRPRRCRYTVARPCPTRSTTPAATSSASSRRACRSLTCVSWA